MASGSTIFAIGALLKYEISELTLTDIKPNDPTDVTSVIFSIGTIILNHSFDSFFSNVSYTNSSVALIKLQGMTAPALGSKVFTFEHLSFSDCYITSPVSLIITDGLVYDMDIRLKFNNLTFTNIEFSTKGYLMKLGHQLPTNAIIIKAKFENIINGEILVTSSHLQNTDLLTGVQMSEIEVSNISHSSNSFIKSNKGSRLYIENSKFSNMDTLNDGAVISGGYQKSVTIVKDTIFENNTAVNGGVFNARDESVIK